MAPPAGADIEQPDCVAAGVGGPSSSHRARMHGWASRWGRGSARRRSGRSRDGRPRARCAPTFARGCGRPHTPGRRARVSSGAGVCRRRPFASARGSKQERPSRPGIVLLGPTGGQEPGLLRCVEAVAQTTHSPVRRSVMGRPMPGRLKMARKWEATLVRAGQIAISLPPVRIAISLPPVRFQSFLDLVVQQPPWKALVALSAAQLSVSGERWHEQGPPQLKARVKSRAPSPAQLPAPNYPAWQEVIVGAATSA
jgi:hypothetical protein